MNSLTFIIMAALTNLATLNISSTAFLSNGIIPSKYTCDGENISPPLSVKNIPAGTKSLVLIVDDPDAPGGTFDHWIIWNVKPTPTIKENTAPGVQGKNGFGKNHYGGPCPPGGTHRYFFKVYAIDILLSEKEGARKEEILKSIQGHVLGTGELIGLYHRKK